MKRSEVMAIYFGLAVVAGLLLGIHPNFSSPLFWAGVVVSGVAIFVRSRWLDLHGLTRETIAWIGIAAVVLIITRFLTGTLL